MSNYLKCDTVATRLSSRGFASMKRDGVNLMIGENNQFSGITTLRMNNKNVPDRNVVRKNLKRFDENRFTAFLLSDNRVGDFQNSAVSCANKKDIVGSTVDTSDTGINGDDRQAFSESGLDKNRS